MVGKTFYIPHHLGNMVGKTFLYSPPFGEYGGKTFYIPHHLGNVVGKLFYDDAM